jgi:hypothetical protein
LTYREAKTCIAENVLDPHLARLCIEMLDRFSGRKRDIRPVFLVRIIQQVTASPHRCQETNRRQQG